MSKRTKLRMLLSGLVVFAVGVFGAPSVEAHNNQQPSALAEDKATSSSSPASDQRFDYHEAVDVELINLHVMVTDRDGKPVDDLSREDFEVFEDGQPVEITNFHANHSSETTEIFSAGGSAVEAEPKPADLPVASDAGDSGHVILFVDNLNIRPENRKKLFVSLRKYLDQPMDPGLRYMVVSMGRKLVVELPFSNDREELLSVLDEVEMQESVHSILDAERRMYMTRLQGSILRKWMPDGQKPQGSRPNADHGLGPAIFNDPHFDAAIQTARQLATQIEPIARRRYDKMRMTVRALENFCYTLGGLEGQKALVYLSDGLSLRPADSLYEAWTGKHQGWVLTSGSDMRRFSTFPDAADYFESIMNKVGSAEFDLTREFRELTEVANDNRVVFYPISDSGAHSSHVSAAVSGGAMGATAGTAMGSAEVMEAASRTASLHLMADNTGGLAFTQSSNLSGLLGRVSRDLDSYYSLGYPPFETEVGEDSDHRRKLEVKVARDDVIVRYGRGYRPRNWRQRLGSMALASARFETQDNPLNLQVEPLGQIEAGERVRIPIMLTVPFEEIRLVHKDGNFVASLTALLVVQSDDGGVSDTIRIDFPIEIPATRILETRNQVAGYTIELEMDKGPARISLGVRDHLARVDSTVNVELMAGQLAL